jgi:hypothetical protein
LNFLAPLEIFEDAVLCLSVLSGSVPGAFIGNSPGDVSSEMKPVYGAFEAQCRTKLFATLAPYPDRRV